MTLETAHRFADEWMNAFNAHDMEAILAHYADDLEFYSPFVRLLKFNETGRITTKADLRRYFQLGLDAYPTLHFTRHQVFAGVDTLVIHYTSVNNRLAAEVFQLDEQGKARNVFCHYTND
jgi:hypothetical protein